MPINGQIRAWVTGSVPAGHGDVLSRWETFTYVRTAAVLVAFFLVVAVVVMLERTREPVPA